MIIKVFNPTVFWGGEVHLLPWVNPTRFFCFLCPNFLKWIFLLTIIFFISNRLKPPLPLRLKLIPLPRVNPTLSFQKKLDQELLLTKISLNKHFLTKFFFEQQFLLTNNLLDQFFFVIFFSFNFFWSKVFFDQNLF